MSPTHPSVDATLEEAARVWGIQPGYESFDQRPARASDEAIMATLRQLGAPVADHGDLPDAIRAANAELWATLVEPVSVCWEGDDPIVRLRALAAELADGVSCRLKRENGATAEWSVGAVDLAARKRMDAEGRAHVVGSLRLPDDLERGYHEITVSAGSRVARGRVIRAPRRAWIPESEGEPPPRAWAAFLPLHALRTARTPGVADLTDLGRLQAWTARHGGALVGTLPLLATFLDQPFDPSPYAPVSRLFWSELYLDPEMVPGIERAPSARALLASTGYRSESERLRAAPVVDYPAAARLRRRAIDALTADLAPNHEALPPELVDYAAAKPEAVDYAAFRAVTERRKKGWRTWPGHLRAGSVGRDEYDEGAFRAHLLAQWATEGQLRDLTGSTAFEAPRAPLYMDLPLGCHVDGFDVWRWPDLFADASAGAPPDLFFGGGQNWGFPPLHPTRARTAGHEYWIDSLRHVMSTAAMLRLDHVMALHRLFWIPPGHTAEDGVYVRYPQEELYAILCIESHRHCTEIVGEDLGTVPEETRAAMDRHALRQMFVVPFELDVNGTALREPASGSVASLGTHDLPPFKGYLEGRDVSDRPRAEQVVRCAWVDTLREALDAEDADPGTLVSAALDRLARGPARLVVLSLEDLWLETEPQNRPGTPSSENWTRKARLTLEDMEGSSGVQSLLAVVDRAGAAGDAEAGRAPHEVAGEGPWAEQAVRPERRSAT